MASDLEAKAKEAFVEDHFELAVDLLSQAINLEPNKAELYADRAQGNIKLKNLTGTLSLPPFKSSCFSITLLSVMCESLGFCYKLIRVQLGHLGGVGSLTKMELFVSINVCFSCCLFIKNK